MFKLVLLAVTLSVCSCQLILKSGLSGLHGLSGDTQYMIVPVQSGLHQSALSLSPYLKREAVTLAAPIQKQVIVQAPKRVFYSQPALKPVVYSTPKFAEKEIYGPAEPYTFGFQSTDELGNSMSRSESSDGNGAVRGSYSYLDVDGLTRTVEYIADAEGYRANVKTNEPGTANANPADVQIESAEAPSQVHQKIATFATKKLRFV